MTMSLPVKSPMPNGHPHQTCINACEKCANECNMFKDQHCQACADTCRQCADECRKMTNM